MPLFSVANAIAGPPKLNKLSIDLLIKRNTTGLIHLVGTMASPN